MYQRQEERRSESAFQNSNAAFAAHRVADRPLSVAPIAIPMASPPPTARLKFKILVSGLQILSRAVGAVFSFAAAPRTIDNCFVCTEDRPEELLSPL